MPDLNVAVRGWAAYLLQDLGLDAGGGGVKPTGGLWKLSVGNPVRYGVIRIVTVRDCDIIAYTGRELNLYDSASSY